MADMTALNYESIEAHLTAIVAAAEGINNCIKIAATKIDSFNSAAITPDRTVEAVRNKLTDIKESLKDVPGQLEEFNRSLREKGESIEAAVSDMSRGIENL